MKEFLKKVILITVIHLNSYALFAQEDGRLQPQLDSDQQVLLVNQGQVAKEDNLTEMMLSTILTSSPMESTSAFLEQ